MIRIPVVLGIFLVLAVALTAVTPAFAEAVSPGDEITVSIPFSSGDPLLALQVDYAISSGLQFVSAKCSGMMGSASASTAVFLSLGGITGGTVILYLKVKADASGEQSVAIHSVIGGSSGETSQKTVGAAVAYSYEVAAVPSPGGTVTPAPTAIPTLMPTAVPTPAPVPVPAVAPTAAPTHTPARVPTAAPTAVPTLMPAPTPTVAPIPVPAAAVTVKPADVPAVTPAFVPTAVPVAPVTVSPVDTSPPGPDESSDTVLNETVQIEASFSAPEGFEVFSAAARNVPDEYTAIQIPGLAHPVYAFTDREGATRFRVYGRLNNRKGMYETRILTETDGNTKFLGISVSGEKPVKDSLSVYARAVPVALEDSGIPEGYEVTQKWGLLSFTNLFGQKEYRVLGEIPGIEEAFYPSANGRPRIGSLAIDLDWDRVRMLATGEDYVKVPEEYRAGFALRVFITANDGQKVSVWTDKPILDKEKLK